MRIVDTIERKRRGLHLSAEEISAVVMGYVRGDVPDYQVAAWLMAVCCRGMSDAELSDLTHIMAASGRQLDLSFLGRPAADKHSTGGVGDKTSVVVVPLVASCGVPVGKMSGRGLGFTGGTLDKLESIPGFSVDLSADRFLGQLGRVGLVISGQTADLVPADGRLYALRDVTGTVPCVPLIASSIMSKKLAGGAGAIVLDVKVGRGAFMKSAEEAREVARRMIAIGAAAGRRVAAFLSNMDQPLGHAVGNALEIREAIATLRGDGPDDLVELCLRLAGEMLFQAGAAPTREAATRMARESLRAGRALAALEAMVEAQGGDPRVVEDDRLLPEARFREDVLAPASGYVAVCDAMAIARAAIALGAGREKKGDRIDLAAGVAVHAKVGGLVEAGEPMATLHANDEGRLTAGRKEAADAFRLQDAAVEPEPLILDLLSG